MIGVRIDPPNAVAGRLRKNPVLENASSRFVFISVPYKLSEIVSSLNNNQPGRLFSLHSGILPELPFHLSE